MSPIRFRKTISLGPLRLNLSRTWPPSLTFKLGPFSWNEYSTGIPMASRVRIVRRRSSLDSLV